MIQKILVAAAGLVLVGCAQVGQLVDYSVSEGELEQLILSEFTRQPPQVNFAGLSAALQMETLDIRIGADDAATASNQIDLATNTTVEASAFGRQFPVQVMLSISGQPRYSADDDAIYLDNVRLQQASVDSSVGAFNVPALGDSVYSVLHRYLNEVPIYRFDANDSRYQLLQRLGLDLHVEPGRLRLKSGRN